MKKGDIIEYRVDKGTEMGTVIEANKEYVTVTKPQCPNETWTILQDRVVSVIRER